MTSAVPLDINPPVGFSSSGSGSSTLGFSSSGSPVASRTFDNASATRDSVGVSGLVSILLPSVYQIWLWKMYQRHIKIYSKWTYGKRRGFKIE